MNGQRPRSKVRLDGPDALSRPGGTPGERWRFPKILEIPIPGEGSRSQGRA